MDAPLVLRVARIVERTVAEGPGLRLALWVQGCHVRCPGCCNPHFFAPEGGTTRSIDDIARLIDATRDGVGLLDGVTFLGGEPFEQPAALAAIGLHARTRGLSVMTFTGHVLEDLRAMPDPGVAQLLAATDLLVDGRY